LSEAQTLPPAAPGLQAELVELFKEIDHVAINKFLTLRGRIGEGQTFRDLDDQYAALILAQPDRFIAAISASQL
jgi:inhibitor of KinA sporulation pathway (predicted exonuclease)